MAGNRRMTITDWVHQQLKSYVSSAECCVDATAGKGNDTLFLCENMKPGGRVFAFDIQKEALDATKALLDAHGFEGQLILDGHEHMDQYIQPESVDVLMFNLGYLPGGDHKLATKAATTITAIEKGFVLLKPGGIMSVCIYSGGDSGFGERDAVLPFLKGLDAKRYTVVMSQFFNKPNDPPIPVLIRKEF